MVGGDGQTLLDNILMISVMSDYLYRNNSMYWDR